MGFSQTPFTAVSPVVQDGVLLLPTSDPNSVGVVPTPRSDQEAALLKYAVVLKNTTSHTIIAYCLRWKCVDSSGVVRPHVFARRNFNTFEGGAAVAPGASRLISRDAGVGNIQNPPAQAGAVTARFEQALRYYRAQRSIEVSLDLSVFDDGTAIGPDTSGWFAKFKGWLDAERDFARLALADGSFAQRVRDAREEGFDALAKDDARTSASLLMAAEMAGDYRTCYQFASAYFASQVQDWIDKTGPSAAIARLRLITSVKHYPTLRKKGEQ